MAKTNIPATGATSRTPRTMNVPVSVPNPPASAAATGTTISATSGDTFLLSRAARRSPTVISPSRASMGRLLRPGAERPGQFGRHPDLQAQQQERERLTVGVQAEGLVDPAVERALQDEVQR